MTVTLTFTNEGRDQQVLVSFGSYSVAFRYKRIVIKDERERK